MYGMEVRGARISSMRCKPHRYEAMRGLDEVGRLSHSQWHSDDRRRREHGSVFNPRSAAQRALRGGPIAARPTHGRRRYSTM